MPCALLPLQKSARFLAAGLLALVLAGGAAAQSGLDSRPPNDTCVALPRPGVDSSAALERVFPNLSLIGIIAMYQAPGDASRWYLVRKPGYIYRIQNVNSVTSKTTVLDLSSRVKSTENGGLLSLAFHPNFATNGQVYLFYTGPGTTVPLITYLSRFRSTDGGATISLASEERLLALDQANLLHHGGTVAFGPDGYLYAAFGDSGLGANAQDTSNLLGDMIRIDVNQTTGYGIPASNPFASGGGRPEIYAWGLRQPYRWSFDRATGELWLGDVGNSLWEEVDLIERGKNYGWPIREGANCRSAGCNPAGLTDPVVEYSHAEGNCVIGGFVYRGSAIPALQGVYIYADWGTGKVWGLFRNPDGTPAPRPLAEAGMKIWSFGQGHDGEVYALEGTQILKVVPAAGAPEPGTFPERLSATGYMDPADPRRPAPCFIPYDLNVPFWSDGAAKERWLAVPDGTGIHIADDGDWVFPVGTVFIKNFRLGGQLIETRLFMRHEDGEWGGYSYEWDDAESDAFLLPGTKTKTVGTTPWTYPSREQCLLCHTDVAGRALGPETQQMNRTFTYAATGRTANQLATYEHIALFDAPLSAPPASLPVLPRPGDAAQPLAARARSYLHANCSHCHRPGGPGRGSADFRFATADADLGVCGVAPIEGDLGVPGAEVLFPGDPSRSVMSLRMHALDEDRMPPIARNVVDADGVAIIDDWISSLTTCTGDPEPIAYVLDNGEPGTSATGGWSVSGGAGFYGVNSLYSKIAGSTYTYRLTLPRAGDYEVFLWWTEFSSRRTDVPVQVTHAGGVATATVNQRLNGSQWNRIGSWSFGTTATVRITSLGGGLSTCADAVALIPAAAPAPADTIVDNGGPGTSSVGYWPVSGAPDPYGANALYSKAANATYTYQVALPGPGTYDVYLWWTEWSSRQGAVPVQVTHAAGAAGVSVDQRVNGGRWNLIGTWTFGAGGVVKITSLGPGTTCADAVRFVPR